MDNGNAVSEFKDCELQHVCHRLPSINSGPFPIFVITYIGVNCFEELGVFSYIFLCSFSHHSTIEDRGIVAQLADGSPAVVDYAHSRNNRYDCVCLSKLYVVLLVQLCVLVAVLHSRCVVRIQQAACCVRYGMLSPVVTCLISLFSLVSYSLWWALTSFFLLRCAKLPLIWHTF